MLAIQFTDTVTLGAGLIAALIGLVGLYRIIEGTRLRATNDIQARTIQALNEDNEHLTERCRDLGAEKDTCLAESAARQATIDSLTKQLDAVPRYQDFMDYTTTTLQHVDSAAASRQQEFLAVVVEELKRHDSHVQEIHDQAELRAIERQRETVNVLKTIAEQLQGGP